MSEAAMETPAVRNLGDVLLARRDSAETAVIAMQAEGKARQFSCRDIESGTRAFAAYLQGRGFLPGERIGILAENSVEYLMAYLGVMRAACVCVPINFKQPPALIDHICKDAEIRAAFVDASGRARLPPGVEALPLETVPADTDFQPLETDPQAPALILYTSGSTGRPKGVVLSHASQWSMIETVISGDDRALFEGRTGIVVAPMFHMNALVFIKSFLLGGGRIVLMSRFDIEGFAAAVRDFQVNVITGVPTMIAMLHREWPRLEQADFSSVKTVYIGSAPVTEAVIAQSLEMMPDARILNSYGTTETGGGLFGPHPDGLDRPPTSVGYPVSQVELRLEDRGEGRGLLHVRAPSAMIGYLNLPELTAKKMRDGWIDTGDLFTRDENGFYYFVGRDDDMFVCSGENVYPGEIEKAIESHPAVVQACVVPKDDVTRGQVPVAFVVSSDPGLSEQDVQDHVRSRAAYYLYPRRVFFVQELPLASTTKIDRKRLIEFAAAAGEQTYGQA